MTQPTNKIQATKYIEMGIPKCVLYNVIKASNNLQSISFLTLTPVVEKVKPRTSGTGHLRRFDQIDFTSAIAEESGLTQAMADPVDVDPERTSTKLGKISSLFGQSPRSGLKCSGKRLG